MPIDLNAGSFKLDSSLDIPADGWSAVVNASPAFRNALDADRVTLNAGFYDDANNQVFIAKVVDAIIDEYALALGVNGLVVTLNGRDKMALLLDKDVHRRYLRVAEPEVVVGGVVRGAAWASDSFPNYFTVVVGTYYAAQIAQQVAGDVGLSVSWGISNYKLNNNYEANKPAYEVIRELAEPFNHLEPFKVDIYVEGTLLLVKPRNGFAMVAEYTYAVTDARILQIALKRRVLPRFHRVTLTGRGEGRGPLSFAQTTTVTRSEAYNNGELVSVEETVSITQQNLHISTVSTTFDQTGVVKRSTARKYYRDGSADLVNETSSPFQGNVPPATDPIVLTIPMNNPMEVAEDCVIEELDEDGDLVVTKRISKSNTYNSELFCIYVVTSESELVEGSFVTTSVINESHLQVTPSITQTVRAEFSRDSDSGQLSLSNRQVSQAGGFSPGGRQAPSPSSGGEPYTRDEIVSTDPRAHDVSFSHEDLTKADIDLLMSQYRQSSGAIEYEVSFTAVGMPWLKKGAIVQLTGLVFEDAVEYTLLPALILSESLSYDESSGHAELITDFRAVFWRPGNPI